MVFSIPGFGLPYTYFNSWKTKDVEVGQNRPSPIAVQMLGLLFARPESKVAKEIVIPNLNYFHLRSGNHIIFKCAGFEEVKSPPANTQGVFAVGGQNWIFSDELFLKAVDAIEQGSKWQYSGGTELLLVNAFLQDSTMVVDMSTAVACQFDRMLEAKAISSIEVFMQDIFRYAKECGTDDPTWGFSDRIGKDTIKSGLFHLVISCLPEALRADAQRAKHFVVTNLAK